MTNLTICPYCRAVCCCAHCLTYQNIASECAHCHRWLECVSCHSRIDPAHALVSQDECKACGGTGTHWSADKGTVQCGYCFPPPYVENLPEDTTYPHISDYSSTTPVEDLDHCHDCGKDCTIPSNEGGCACEDGEESAYYSFLYSLGRP